MILRRNMGRDFRFSQTELELLLQEADEGL